MNHRILDEHDVIAWDIDGTIVDGPNSEYFLAYINAHPEKKHFIITFRPEDWAEHVYSEIEWAVSRDKIAGVYSCPQMYWEAHNRLLRFDTDTPEAQAYVEWKGKMAAELGCTVLVDDMDYLVVPGCIKYGIEFVHALHRYDPGDNGVQHREDQ